MADVYRQAASILLLRPSQVYAPDGSSVVYDLLLLHKPRKHDAWQLPQGGIEEGETPLQAALRELQEEASLTDCQVLGKSEKVYQYDFPNSFRRFRPDDVKGQRIVYVYALAPADTKVQVDQKEIDEFVWIRPSQLASYVRREQYLSLARSLYDEAAALAQKIQKN